MPKTFNTTIATFADDTALLAVGNTLEECKERLQQAVSNVAIWTKRWRVKLNETELTYINFTNMRIDKVLISINDVAPSAHQYSKVPRRQTPLERTCQEKSWGT